MAASLEVAAAGSDSTKKEAGDMRLHGPAQLF
jgi:hypothetical protein